MKTEVTEQERNAIESYANNHAGISDDKFANSAKKYDAYDLCDAVQKGAEFALSELRKPSESEPIDFTPKLREYFENTPCEDILKAWDSIKRFDVELTGRTDEELVQKIESVMYSHAAPLPASGLQIIYIDSVNKIATEIAKLLPSYRCQQNGKPLTDFELKDLKRVRNYFGEHDVSPIEHFAYSFLDGLLSRFSQKQKTTNTDRLLHRLKLSIMAHPDYHRG